MLRILQRFAQDFLERAPRGLDKRIKFRHPVRYLKANKLEATVDSREK